MLEIDQPWDAFVIYVNAYYAVQEAYDSARRNWEKPAPGLNKFVRDANPFLWDERGSAEPEIYEGFSASFLERFGTQGCTAAEGRAFASEWLRSLEGETFGHHLVASLDEVADERAWEESCEPIARQLSSRAAHLERTPQDEPLVDVPGSLPQSISEQNIEAVIELLAKGDQAFATSLRARLHDEE